MNFSPLYLIVIVKTVFHTAATLYIHVPRYIFRSEYSPVYNDTTMPLILYSLPLSQPCRSVLMFLKLNDIEFSTKKIDVIKRK